MRRIGLEVLLALGLFLVPVASEAQQAGKVYRIGMLEPFSTAEAVPYRQAFFDAMRELGYIEGRNVIFDVRTGDRDTARLPPLVDELIALKPDVLVGSEVLAQVAQAKAVPIPVVMTISFDPVGAGVAQSLRRPGMNVTGVALFLDQLAGKHIEIMRETLPRLAPVGLIVDTTVPSIGKVVETGAGQAARSVGATLVIYRVANRNELEQAFSRMETERPDFLMPCPTPMLFNNRDLLYSSAIRLRIPFTSFVTANLPLGVLFAYAPSFAEGYRKAASYVDKILKGAKGGEVPIEQPTRLEFVLNLKTAKTMGLTIPSLIRLRADQIIE
jgi:putative ABC transport system substrate-binding protein